MDITTFRRLLTDHNTELVKYFSRNLPIKAGATARSFVRENFRLGGFRDGAITKWQVTRRQLTGKGADAKRGPLLSSRRVLYSGTNYTPGNGRVIIYNDVAYAAIHNHILNGYPFVDICDELSVPAGSTNIRGKGCYPKDFKFTGWHPLCRCHAVSILKTDEEIDEDLQRILDGEPLDGKSVNRVEEVPKEFKQWLNDNAERITKASSRGTLPYFIRNNHKASIAAYARYKSNPAYKDVEINGSTWGVKATTHKGHIFDKRKGWYEIASQNAGYNAGHRVVLENEPQDMYRQRSCEGLWDEKKFEVAGAETATPNNIRNALKHCASKPDCEISIVFFPNKEVVSMEAIRSGISKYTGLEHTKQYRKFSRIYFIVGEEIIHSQ